MTIIVTESGAFDRQHLLDLARRIEPKTPHKRGGGWGDHYLTTEFASRLKYNKLEHH